MITPNLYHHNPSTSHPSPIRSASSPWILR